MRAMLFPGESRCNVVEVGIALGSSRNSSLGWSCAPWVLVFVRLGYGLYNDISLVLGLANDIRTRRGFPVLASRWAYWLLQERGTAFMLRFLFGRRLLSASRGELVKPGVVHFVCSEHVRRLSFQCSRCIPRCCVFVGKLRCVDCRSRALNTAWPFRRCPYQIAEGLESLESRSNELFDDERANRSALTSSQRYTLVERPYGFFDIQSERNCVGNQLSIELEDTNLSPISRARSPLYDDVNEMLIGSGPFLCDHTCEWHVSIPTKH